MEYHLFINDHIDDIDWEASLPLLSEQRREQVLRFKHILGRRTCVAAYLLLRKALLEVYGITEKPVFEYGEHGKPYIVGHPELHFSLSHCKEAAVCVLSRRPVGIDVESIGRYRDAVARYAMSDEELQQIQQAALPEVAFTRLWTMKESLLKLTGEGINDKMKETLENANIEWFTTVERLDKNYIYTVCEQ
jgi:4'-phosphopantetheinyl transferase